MTETGFFRGEGGSIFEMDLPLSEVMQNQLERRQLVRVNEDGSPWETPADAEHDPAAGTVVPTRPAVAANKPAWVAWAIAQGASADEADAMTKNDLIEKYGK
jgi:hypothetical protein